MDILIDILKDAIIFGLGVFVGLKLSHVWLKANKDKTVYELLSKVKSKTRKQF